MKVKVAKENAENGILRFSGKNLSKRWVHCNDVIETRQFHANIES